MIVYRIEDDKGRGPVAQWDCPFKMNIRYHKEPCDMAMAGECSISHKEYAAKLDTRQYLFAWGSIYDMMDFIKYPRSVDDTNWRVVVYELTDAVTFKDGQVMFHPDNATAVGGSTYCGLIDDYRRLRWDH